MMIVIHVIGSYQVHAYWGVGTSIWRLEHFFCGDWVIVFRISSMHSVNRHACSSSCHSSLPCNTCVWN
jgi:hypothetical protein